MMTCSEIRQNLEQQATFLRRTFKVKKIGVFGSYAREQADENSDVDLLVEFSEPIGWEFIDLKEYLEDLLGKPVDLVTDRALKPQLRDSVLDEVLYV